MLVGVAQRGRWVRHSGLSRGGMPKVGYGLALVLGVRPVACRSCRYGIEGPPASARSSASEELTPEEERVIAEAMVCSAFQRRFWAAATDDSPRSRVTCWRRSRPGGCGRQFRRRQLVMCRSRTSRARATLGSPPHGFPGAVMLFGRLIFRGRAPDRLHVVHGGRVHLRPRWRRTLHHEFPPYSVAGPSQLDRRRSECRRFS